MKIVATRITDSKGDDFLTIYYEIGKLEQKDFDTLLKSEKQVVARQLKEKYKQLYKLSQGITEKSFEKMPMEDFEWEDFENTYLTKQVEIDFWKQFNNKYKGYL